MAQIGGLSRLTHSILRLTVLWRHSSPVSLEVPVQLGTCGFDLMSTCLATITDFKKINLCLRSYDL
jgi:hypothetical protein